LLVNTSVDLLGYGTNRACWECMKKRKKFKKEKKKIFEENPGNI
jgi:hypothetical protein